MAPQIVFFFLFLLLLHQILFQRPSSSCKSGTERGLANQTWGGGLDCISSLRGHWSSSSHIHRSPWFSANCRARFHFCRVLSISRLMLRSPCGRQILLTSRSATTDAVSWGPIGIVLNEIGR